MLIEFIWLDLISINAMIWEIKGLLLLDSLNFILKAVNQFHESNIQLIAAFNYCIRRSNQSISLNLHFNFFLKRMRLFVACKFNIFILEKLIPDAVSKSVVLVMDRHCSCKSLSLIVFVCHSINLNIFKSFKYTYFETVDESPPIIYY